MEREADMPCGPACRTYTVIPEPRGRNLPLSQPENQKTIPVNENCTAQLFDVEHAASIGQVTTRQRRSVLIIDLQVLRAPCNRALSMGTAVTSAQKYSLCAIETLSCINNLHCPVGQPNFQNFSGIRTKRAPYWPSWVFRELECRIVTIVDGIIRADERPG